MAFARHNIEKRRLIELVRLNPILWDCRLPHYKRSDKKKALKWNELGRIFNVNGERVQRTFTSLREIFRRELNHEKMLGTRFKSKWEYYEEMAFLKEVIRERKSRERAKSGDVTPQNFTASNNNNNNSHVIDEYQYFAPNDPNNPQIQQQQQQQQQQQLQQQSMNSSLTQQQQQHLKQLPLIPTTINNSISLNLPIPPVLTTIPSQPSGPLQLPTDMLMNLNANALAALQKFTHTNGNTVRPPSRARSLIIRSCSSSPSIYIKEEEADSLDDTISLDTITAQEKSIIEQRNKMIEKNPTTSTTKPLNNKESNSISHSANLRTSTTKNKNNTLQNLIIDEEQIDVSDLDDDPDVDMIEDDERLSIATAIISLNKRPAPKEAATTYAQQHRSSPREILYTKFGEFLAARLNTLNETIANELMNKILMLIAEK